MTETEKVKAFWKLIVDTEGNPSVSDIKALGFSEGWALETVIRISQFGPETIKKMVADAKARIAE